MKSISHQDQQRIWEEEHAHPQVLLPMDSNDASSGVVLFLEWLQSKGECKGLNGIDIGCGKGRNSIFMAKQGMDMVGFDFSPTAIAEASERAKVAGVNGNTQFIVHDASERWPFEDGLFDFAIDCFASTDIESLENRMVARDECWRVLKPGGHLFVYSLSTDEEFHTRMRNESPAEEEGAFLHPRTGKFEKMFSRDELMDFYRSWTLVEERRVPKVATFFGEKYSCNHFWLVFRKG